MLWCFRFNLRCAVRYEHPSLHKLAVLSRTLFVTDNGSHALVEAFWITGMTLGMLALSVHCPATLRAPLPPCQHPLIRKFRHPLIINSWFMRYSLADWTMMYNGTEFDGVFRHLLKRFGVDHIQTSTYDPPSNGAVERLVRTMKTMLAAKVAGRARLDSVAPANSHGAYAASLCYGIFPQ